MNYCFEMIFICTPVVEKWKNVNDILETNVYFYKDEVLLLSKGIST